jgi:hypothetical protein
MFAEVMPMKNVQNVFFSDNVNYPPLISFPTPYKYLSVKPKIIYYSDIIELTFLLSSNWL